jgi:hypothetical protein
MDRLGALVIAQGEKMNTKQRITVILILVMNLVMSGCGPGQMFGPTMTPTATLTPTPTFTPTPVCSTENGEWTGEGVSFKVNDCTISDLTVLVINGDQFSITSVGGTIPIVSDKFESGTLSGTFTSPTECACKVQVYDEKIDVKVLLEK